MCHCQGASGWGLQGLDFPGRSHSGGGSRERGTGWVQGSSPMQGPGEQLQAGQENRLKSWDGHRISGGHSSSAPAAPAQAPRGSSKHQRQGQGSERAGPHLPFHPAPGWAGPWQPASQRISSGSQTWKSPSPGQTAPPTSAPAEGPRG
uniref:Uncharacterized protein n=1 Tax=Rousettus aegyptiacus TaxID=9407 RepID=A0A7J8GBQ6_ROUAE|nr:hypothetical protein HJG63_011788 [Rousettus aegyptiacus]